MTTIRPVYLRTDLLRAWERWDDRPGDREAAVAMNAACGAAAPTVDLTHNQFREVISGLRRTGMDREAILDWLGIHDAT